MKLFAKVGSVVSIVALMPSFALASDTLLKEIPVDLDLANQAKTRPFTLVLGSKKFTATAKQASLWFKTRQLDGQTVLQLRPGAIYDYLNVSISPKVNQLGTNSRFIRENGQIKLVSGGTKGRIVDGIKTSLAIRAAIAAGKDSAAVSMKEFRPSIFSATDFEKLSFPTLLATGESNFAGSPKNRIHNIKVATNRFDGVLIMPDEQFSFVSYLGNVDASTGYLPELVIKENVTTPEYGGGICQVSTTAFRGAMQAGLKIVARSNHSYPVAYYGTPGYDATVYTPAPDLQFINDTGNPIYLHTKIVGSKVFFEFWGKSDGRQVKVNGPFVTQKKPDGSITAAVAQLISKNGKSIREENFVSHYQPAAKFPHVVKENGG